MYQLFRYNSLLYHTKAFRTRRSLLGALRSFIKNVDFDAAVSFQWTVMFQTSDKLLSSLVKMEDKKEETQWAKLRKGGLLERTNITRSTR